MKNKDSIFILITFINGTYTDWIEITKQTLNSIHYDILHSPSEHIWITDISIDMPFIANKTQIQSIEVDVPTDDELKELKNNAK